MAARKTAPGSPKREAEHPDDVFVARTLEFSEWARQNTQILIIFGIVLALIVGGLLYYVNYSRERQVQATMEMERIQQTLGVGEVEVARAELLTYVDRFEGTSYALEARLLLGQLYLESGQPQEAIDVLEPAAQELDEPMGIQTAVLLAKAYEEQGAVEEAESTYLQVADAAELDFQVNDALADAARLRTEGGDLEGAAELYRRILDGMEEGDQDRGLYEMRLQEVTTEADV